VTPSGEEPIAAGGWPFDMTKQMQLRRALALTLLVCAAFAGLGYRLVDLQVLRHQELSERAQATTEREFWQEPQRGEILDCHGNPLAISVPVETICADPSLIGNQQAVVARAIAPLLQMDEADIYQKLFPHVFKNEKGEFVTNNLHYVRLAKNISQDTWQKIQTAMNNLSFGVDEKKLSSADKLFLANLRKSAVYAEPSQMRVYPNGSLAAQVLGFCGMKETEVSDHYISQMIGRDGVELSLNSELSGVAGWRVTETDRQQHEIVPLRDEDVHPHDGLNVELTIDSVIQHIVEEALAKAYRDHSPENITGIVIRPKTGEILAMASLPEFDPNNLETINTNNEANVVINSVMEPGSTFKTIVISGALNDHVVTLNDSVFCENGVFHYGGITLHDAEHDHFGMLTVEQVLQKSSNIGASKIGIKMGPEKLYDYMTDYGLGQATGIPLPGELSARQFVRPPVDASGKPIWGKYSIAQIPMGQGVAVTRLQMAMVVSAIANNGVLMRPMLVKDLKDSNGNIVQQYQPQAVRRVIAPEAAKEMVEALKTVVTKDGTAPLAALTNYVVAGKTGTAEKTEVGHTGYVEGKYVVTFIGFFPADDPQLCISIVMDAPKEGGRAFGGALCGPVFHDIAVRCASYLNIPPDQNLQMQNAPLVATGTH
jgi:cell division protein FtsI/penicillin-binding protein 2